MSIDLMVQEIEEAVKNSHAVDSSWTATKDDLLLVVGIMSDADCDLEEAIENVRVDSKTHRLMTRGWVVYDDEYYYSNEQDAENKMKELGFTSIADANEQYATEDDDCPICYYTEWYEI